MCWSIILLLMPVHWVIVRFFLAFVGHIIFFFSFIRSTVLFIRSHINESTANVRPKNRWTPLTHTTVTCMRLTFNKSLNMKLWKRFTLIRKDATHKKNLRRSKREKKKLNMCWYRLCSKFIRINRLETTIQPSHIYFFLSWV